MYDLCVGIKIPFLHYFFVLLLRRLLILNVWRARCAILTTSPPQNRRFLTKNTSPPPLAMPRSILLRPPGGASGKVRKRYTLVEKLMLIDKSDRLRRDCNLSLRRAAEVIGVPVQVLSRWQKEVPTIHAAIADQPQTRNRKVILDGPKGTLGSVEMDLLV